MSQHVAPHSFAACLLLVVCVSTAAADSPATRNNAPYRVELPDGATVELVGVSEPPPGGGVWWRPDGSPLAIVPGGNAGSSLEPHENSIVRRFAVYLVTDGKADVNEPGPLGPDVVWYAQSSGSTTKERVGNKILEKRQFMAAMPPDSRTSIVVKYAGGPWKTVASVGPKGAASFGFEHGAGIVWDGASDEDGAARIAAAYHVEQPLTRIVALDDRGEEHESEPRMGGTANNVRLRSARFPGLPIARVKAFHFQSRTFDHEIDFRYVSLHAGQKSPVRMYLDGFRYLPKTTGAIERIDSPKLVSSEKRRAEMRPGEKGPHPQTATDDEVLKRILANWRARQDRTKSFRYAWNTRYSEEGTSRTRVHELRRALWVAGDDRFRFERAVVSSPQYWRARNAQDLRAFDGSTHYVLEWLQSPSDAPLGAIRAHKEMQDFDDLECDPLYLTFRPFHQLGWGDSKFRIVARHEIVDGRTCIKLERVDGQMKEYCSVDPNRDDLLVSFERAPRQWRDDRTFRYAVSYRAISQFGWIPERWVCRCPSSDYKLHCEATTLAVNEQLPADAFRIDFPPGALVFDLPSRKQFVIAADGSKAPAPPFESVSSPALRQALDVVESFTIEAEPIKDAIDFLCQHHKLPIDFDRAAFLKAGLNGDTQCQCDIKGLTMREQLRWLLAVLPKPIYLVEKKGELILTPASSSKPNEAGGQGSPKSK
jgi:hypothetical protein